MPNLLYQHEPSPTRKARQRQARARRGAIWLGFLFIMLIVFASLALAVNWTYGLLLQRHQQRLCDFLALGAVEQLLDDGLLADDAVTDAQTNQTDDLLAAQNALLDPSTGLLKRNNDANAAPFRPDAADIVLKFGRLDDATFGPNAEALPGVPNFSNDPNGPLYNTLWVDIRRGPASMRRVFPLIRGMIKDNEYQLSLSASSFASLDSRVVGYRPIASSAYPDTNKNAPLLPFAVNKKAWFNTRPTLGDSNGNGRKELWLELKETGADSANAALIDFDAALNIDTADLPNQIQNGIGAALMTSGEFGPAHPSVTYSVDGSEQSPANLAEVQTALQNIIGTNQAKRVLPIFNTFNSTLLIEGYVGAEILEVDLAASRLRVLVEPAFVIHSTAVTRRTITDSFATEHAIDENLYVHKIRLTK